MIVLDTNVISELARGAPHPGVLTWVDARSEILAITAVTVGELLYGVARLPTGRRRSGLAAVVEALIDQVFAEKVLAYDRAAAVEYADVVATRDAAGSPISAADAQIAGICRNAGALLATRNVRDFVGTGVDVVDPWTGVGP